MAHGWTSARYSCSIIIDSAQPTLFHTGLHLTGPCPDETYCLNHYTHFRQKSCKRMNCVPNGNMAQRTFCWLLGFLTCAATADWKPPKHSTPPPNWLLSQQHSPAQPRS